MGIHLNFLSTFVSASQNSKHLQRPIFVLFCTYYLEQRRKFYFSEIKFHARGMWQGYFELQTAINILKHFIINASVSMGVTFFLRICV